MSAERRTASAAVLDRRLDQTVIEERRRALRALLMRPLLTGAGDTDGTFPLVRRHAAWLRAWLARHAGWRLRVDAEVARLYKVPADLRDATRPARDPKSATPFSRRRYVLFCLALAALERSDRQTTLGRLAADVVRLAAADPVLAESGIDFELLGRDQRRDIVQVMRVLLALRIIERVDGDEADYVAGSGDVLYRVDRPALAVVLAAPRPPSTLDDDMPFDERLASLVEEPLPDTDEGRNRRLRYGLSRRLLDDPVLYDEDLTEDERRYLASQRAHLVAQIEEATGLVPEVRAEGLAMVDERGALSDLAMPEEGTDGHVALLLAEFLAAESKAGREVVTRAAVHRKTAELIREHASHWRRGVTAPGADADLAEATLDRLEALGLVRRVTAGVRPQAAVARFALGAVDEASAPVQGELWSEER